MTAFQSDRWVEIPSDNPASGGSDKSVAWEEFVTQQQRESITIEKKKVTDQPVEVRYSDILNGENWAKAFYYPASSGNTIYTYYALEVKVDNDTNVSPTYSRNGNVETVTNTVPGPDTVDVSAKKIWNDNRYTPFTYHPQVTFTLYRKALADGETAPTGDNIPKTADAARTAGYSVVVENDESFSAVKTIPAGTTNTTNNMTVFWTGLPEKDADGKTYAYIVIENKVANYTLNSVEVTPESFDYTLTNKLNEENTKLTVNKVWNLNGKVVEDTSDTEKYPEVTYQVWQVTYTDAARTTRKDGTTATGTQLTPNTGYTGTLNETNSWQEEINSLPKMRITAIAADGTVTAEYYSYYVTEDPIPNADGDAYIVSYKAGNGQPTSTASGAWVGAAAEGSITITNGKYSIDVSVLKTDPTGSPLTGATFRLQKLDGSWTNVYADPKKDDDDNGIEGYYRSASGSTNQDFSVGKDGKLHVENLANGTYRFEEVKSPDGYVITEKYPASFTIKDGVITPQSSNVARYESSDSIFIVPNTPGVALPSTGGRGTRLFTILGSILVLGAGVLLVRRRRSLNNTCHHN